MQSSSKLETLSQIVYLTGSAETAARLQEAPALVPFDDRVLAFLDDVSKLLLRNRAVKAFSDVVTFAFWIRKASLLQLRRKYFDNKTEIQMGKGVAFHIAPSNVPCNFAYSAVAGLLCGNANIVRVPSKDFEQVRLITEAVNEALKDHPDMTSYVLLVRYQRDKKINDLLSSLADVRVIWGGDNTIAELRQSPLPPRSSEITFADRYSLAVIDADEYLAQEDKGRIAEGFYNDTFFSDQNACTSPRIIIWTGEKIQEAKKEFWTREHELVRAKYNFQAIQSVNKLNSSCLAAAATPGTQIVKQPDNLIVRVQVPKISNDLMNYKDNSGFFFEYDCKENILEIANLCRDKQCQTVAYIGDGKKLLPLVNAGIKGIDRIVPMGKTMDFDLIWDGYDLPALLTRKIVLI